MRTPKAVGATIAVVFAVLMSFSASPASATTICTAGTLTSPCTSGHPGGAFAMTATNLSLTVSGGGTFSCADSTLSGTAPATTTTTVSSPVSLSISNCSAFGTAYTATVPATCQAGGATPLLLQVMWNQAAAPQAAVSLLVPSGCTITFNAPVLSCTLTIGGPQTIGNGTSGTGGIAWTNGTATTKSFASLASATIPSVVSSGGGFGCPAAGGHTGTFTGVFTVTSPASSPGVTVIP